MRALAGRGREEGKELRRLWKSSGGGISGGRASRRGRTNRRGTGTGGSGESLISGECATCSTGVDPKSRGLSGGGGWAGKRGYWGWREFVKPGKH